jgi:hypothetical protein
MFIVGSTLTRRLVAAAGVVCAGLAAATVPASPAAASPGPIQLQYAGNSQFICDFFTGQSSVGWVVSSSLDEPVTVAVGAPTTGTVTPATATIPAAPAGSTAYAHFHEMLNAGTASAEVTVHVTAVGVDSSLTAAVPVTACYVVDNPLSISGTVQCNPAGAGATVTWTVTDIGKYPASVNGVTALTPAGARVAFQGMSLESGSKRSFTESTDVNSGNAGVMLDVSLNVDATNNDEQVVSPDVVLSCAHPSPTVGQGATGGPGQTGVAAGTGTSPSPSPGASASPNPSPSPGVDGIGPTADSSVRLTVGSDRSAAHSSTWLYAVLGVVLLALGAGGFLVVRRVRKTP